MVVAVKESGQANLYVCDSDVLDKGTYQVQTHMDKTSVNV
jgi:hypothetical protein